MATPSAARARRSPRPRRPRRRPARAAPCRRARSSLQPPPSTTTGSPPIDGVADPAPQRASRREGRVAAPAGQPRRVDRPARASGRRRTDVGRAPDVERAPLAPSRGESAGARRGDRRRRHGQPARATCLDRRAPPSERAEPTTPSAVSRPSMPGGRLVEGQRPWPRAGAGRGRWRSRRSSRRRAPARSAATSVRGAQRRVDLEHRVVAGDRGVGEGEVVGVTSAVTGRPSALAAAHQRDRAARSRGAGSASARRSGGRARGRGPPSPPRPRPGCPASPSRLDHAPSCMWPPAASARVLAVLGQRRPRARARTRAPGA